eukprot:TRINITY_DN55244_c0_g1_i1.p1 TRINITY_DN55244_c0_g1~~TRINITY_DN55244_c0_g1_i1.p1  ORF type:complete len:276 (+),score=57.42 TRINITY_DN55244_c0_g1_i1:153-980(+)
MCIRDSINAEYGMTLVLHDGEAQPREPMGMVLSEGWNLAVATCSTGMVLILVAWYVWSPEEMREEDGGTAMTRFDEELRELRVLKGTPFDHADPSHEEYFEQLWRCTFETDRTIGMGSPEWCMLGFSPNVEPHTDLRGTGMLGVQNLCYFATKYPGRFRRIVERNAALSVEQSLPVACVGINITSSLNRMVTEEESVYRLVARGGREAQFEELYCSLFSWFDARWERAEMEVIMFNVELEQLLQEVVQLVGKQSWRDLEQMREQADQDFGQSLCT